MLAMGSEYYQPANVFRQPAIIVKKRSHKRQENSISIDTSAHHRKTWKNDPSKLGSHLLRKASDDFNDHYSTKKLKSEFWKMDRDSSLTSLPTDLSVVDDTLLVSNMGSENNLKLVTIDTSTSANKNEATSLREIQTISVPGTPVTSSCLLPSNLFSADYFENHDQLLLCGHQDGVVNLISTSMENGGAKIAKRYKHGKFLSHDQSNQSKLDKWLQPFTSYPIRRLRRWNDTGFTSLVNDSLFIYDLNRSRQPQYLQSFPGLESASVNEYNNPYLLALCGSHFGNSGIALLDLRSDNKTGNLYIPDCTNNDTSSLRSFKDCTWIDEYHVANCINDCVKVWDIRATGGQPKAEILPMKGCIESMLYRTDSKTLYTDDDQGNIISWDLTGFDNMKKATLAQGFNSILVQNTQEFLHEVSQCGNIIVNGESYQNQFSKNSVRGSTMMDTLSTGALITLDSQELGLHQICEVEVHTSATSPHERISDGEAEHTNEVSLQDEREQEDSDVTLLAQDSSSLSNHSDCSSSHTLHSVESHETAALVADLKLRPNVDMLYSLKNLVLSGSTIYQETII